MRYVTHRQRTGVVFVALIASACRPHPLEEVPVRGGTPEQREAVRREILAFAEDIAPETFTLDAVRIENIAERQHARGIYYEGKIRLEKGLGLFAIREVARHELCHAYDHAAGWASERRPLDLDLVAWQAGNYSYPDEPNRVKREAFALMCERGPFLLDALSQPSCDGDPPFVAPAAEEVLAWAYPGWVERDLPAVGHLEPVLSFTERPSTFVRDERTLKFVFDVGELYFDTEERILGLTLPGPATRDIPAVITDLPVSERVIGVEEDFTIGLDGGPVITVGALQGADLMGRALLRSPDGEWVNSTCYDPVDAYEDGYTTSSLWLSLPNGEGGQAYLTPTFRDAP